MGLLCIMTLLLELPLTFLSQESQFKVYVIIHPLYYLLTGLIFFGLLKKIYFQLGLYNIEDFMKEA